MHLLGRLRGAPFLALAGCGLTVIGGGALALLYLHFDPATAGEGTRALITAAFVTAQSGLALLAIKIFHGLYRSAVRISDRHDRRAK